MIGVVEVFANSEVVLIGTQGEKHHEVADRYRQS